jgi:hypothetical protein
MQVITSAQASDESSGAKLPQWDRVKLIYKRLCFFLQRIPNRKDDFKVILTKKQRVVLYDIAGESQNNCNKYIAAACLGEKFMTIYEQTNTMHMKCTFVITFMLIHVEMRLIQIIFSCTYSSRLTKYYLVELKGQKVPQSLQEKNTRGTVSGLKITGGLPTTTTLFVMAKHDIDVGASIEILNQLREGCITVKAAQKELKASKELKVLFEKCN